MGGFKRANCRLRGDTAMGISILVERTQNLPSGTALILSDYGDAVTEAEFSSQRFDAPGKLTFSSIEEGGNLIEMGSPVTLAVDGKPVFKGYIFTAERNRYGETTYTAYDQLRYLKANASYTFEAMTLGQIIAQIASDFGLTVGMLEDTGYAFPCLIKEDESCLDIIFEALSQTIIQTGRIFNFYDQAGELILTEAKNMCGTILAGDESMVTDYTYKCDIDSHTYNRIKLVRPNSETGRADVYLHEDTDNIKKWGLLQYYSQVDENLNEAQIDQMCAQYLQYYNRITQTLTLEGLGITGIRAGSIVPVRIEVIDDLSAPRLLLAEKVTHKFESGGHTMSIAVKDFGQLGVV